MSDMEGDPNEDQGASTAADRAPEIKNKPSGEDGQGLAVSETDRSKGHVDTGQDPVLGIPVDPRAKALEGPILLRYFRGMSIGLIAKEFRLSKRIVTDCIQAAPEQMIESSRQASLRLPDLGKKRLAGMVPDAVETVRSVMQDKRQKGGSRLRAADMVLSSAGINTQYGKGGVMPGKVNQFFISRDDLKEMIQGAQDAGAVIDVEPDES